MSFFDDDALPEEPRAPRPRRKASRSRRRIQRLAIFLVVLFVIVFVLAVAVSKCQKHAKESAYRSYFTSIDAAIKESNAVGKEIGDLLANPGKLKRPELQARLDDLEKRQAEITARAQRIKPPSKLSELHSIFVLGMKVRQRGVQQVRDGLLAAIGKKNTKATAAKLAALSGYFTGPDVYYTELYQSQAKQVMADDGVTKVAVPASDYFLKNDLFDAGAIEAALKRAAASTSKTGRHGVGLVNVVAESADNDPVRLSPGQDTKVPSAPDLEFAVTLENQGSVTENDVPVKLTFSPAGGDTQTLDGTIAAIGPGERQTVKIGVDIPATAISKTSSLKVRAGPVKGEKMVQNNQATYGVILEFQQ